LSDLNRYPDERVVYELMAIARYFDSAFLRRQAISQLGFSKSPYAARGLVSLLDVQFPRTLKAEAGWRQSPRDINEELHKSVVDALKRTTKEDFGDNAEAWTRWLDSHGVPPLPRPGP